MRMTTLAASLISAGIATLITAHVVEKRLLEEFDERLEQELEASVNYLVERKKAEPTEEYEKRIFGTRFDPTKPPVEEIANKHQRVRYDAVIKGEHYTPSEAKDLEVAAEGDVEACDTLGELYAISTEEFMENESGYLQSSVFWYADGGVLDEHGELVVDFEDMIGNGPPPFGELSGEPHIVYLRNDRIKREFEVVRDEGNAADILSDPDPSGVVT